MILLQKGQTSNITVTLAERQTLADANYLFVFQGLSGDKVKFVLQPADDLSLQTDRFNLFSIDVDTYFSSVNTGMYSYRVYEQASTSDTTETGKTLIETGIMKLKPAEDFSISEYAGEQTTYKVYDAG